jgi:hypothetical protein
MLIVVIYHPKHHDAAVEMQQKLAEMGVAAKMCASDLTPETDGGGNPCFWVANDDAGKVIQCYWRE